MAAFEDSREALAELGVSVFAATVDSEEKTAEVADSGITFPLGYGVDRQLGDRIGAWWEDRRDHIQPAEFLIRRDGRVIHSSYSSSPIGRTDPEDVISVVQFVERLAAKKAARDG